MNEPNYIHLRLHSEYSVTDGIVRVSDKPKNNAAVMYAKKLGLPAFGLTDLMNLFGMVKHYKACRAEGIKPIVGVDIWVENEEDPHKPYRALLLAKNRAGYGRLCTLLTQAFRTNQRLGRAEIKKSWIAAESNDSLICLSGAQLGEIGIAAQNHNHAVATAAAQWWSQQFPDSFYLELQRSGQIECDASVAMHLQLADELNLPVVATHPIQFMEREDFKAHEARVCIAEGYMVADKRRPRHFTEEQYFKTPEEMQQLFADIPEALANTVEIAKRCNLTVQLGKNYLPQFPTPEGMTLDDFLYAQAKEGLEKRLLVSFPDEAEREKQRPTYEARLKFETETIKQMGFPGYFLIVADFINWAKHNGCPVGPGRGSGAGSLVAFSLGITDLDPLPYALLFERFLNPERVSMPDFDIDFCQDNRGKVIEYVRDKYGTDAVSQIATFGTMAAKAVIRDVGRVLDLSYTFCDNLSKMIPAIPGKPVTLLEAMEQVPELKDRVENDDEVKELWDLAIKLEGMTRNVGMHAGGVLIAPGQLTDFCPLYQADGADSSPVSQYDKNDVEAVGLVKFDFLGLRNLTIIELALQYIEETTGKRLDLMSLGFEDPAAYKILQDANTTAVFQVESDGMKRLLEKLKPDRFEDIIAVLALYRPGPLGSGMVDSFINRKKGIEKPEYYHPDLTACLEPTYGVIVYQEQVMQISQIIGGYTLGGADMLRRAMGKKDMVEMNKHRSTICSGAAEKGYDPELAGMLFDLMTKFAEYGFNKSHTAAYAVISYQTAWLKAHYPSEFMAATMSSEMDNTDQLKIFFDDCVEKNNLKILSPDINSSFYRFRPVSHNEISYALGAVKGVGEGAVEMIVRERVANGPYKDLYDFCRRTDKKEVNKRVIEALIRAGAFDLLDDHRARLLANVEQAMQVAEAEAANANQCSLFDMFEEAHVPSVAMIEVERWDERKKLAEEKTAIGFYLSGHPFAAHAETIKKFIKTRLDKLQAKREPQTIAGIVTALRVKNGERGRMAFIQLDDGNGKREVSVFSDAYEANRLKIKTDALLIIEGKINEDRFNEGSLRIIADKIYDIAEARSLFAQALKLKVKDNLSPDQLKALLIPWQNGVCPVEIEYLNQKAKCTIRLGDNWRVTLDEELLTQLKNRLGVEFVAVH